MNKIYKSKWNSAIGQWVAVSELTSGKSKSTRLCQMILSSALLTIGVTAGSLAYAGVINNSTDISTTNSTPPIFDVVTDGTDTDITNTGAISTQANNTGAIYVENTTGQIVINNQGNLSTAGNNANAILAKSSAGNVKITNNGQVITNGDVSHGIYAYRDASGGNITINNNGLVHITGSADSRAVMAHDTSTTASNITINNTGTILHDVEANGHHGIDAVIKSDTSVVVNNSGSVSGGQYGIVVWSGNTPNVNSQGVINIESTGRIDSGNGLTMDLSNSNTMNIAEGATVNGKRNALQFRTDGAVTPVNTVNNAGKVTSELDKLLSTRYQFAGAETVINNTTTGNISGFITADKTDVTVNNAGLWNLRNFADSTGDHVRDKKAVAISNFGSGTNAVNNTGTLNLAAVSGETSFIVTGEYLPLGSLSIANAGTVQGQLLNLNTFENSGLIDMTANNQAGDVLVITGGATAGTFGGGAFTSNGGALKMNTLLNEGGIARLTDILVLDDVQVGANGVTKVYIAPTTDSQGEYTPGDGIKVIETLGTQDARAFTLGNAVVSGAYEYKLFSTDLAGNQNGFYLRSQRNNLPMYNPNIGSYIGNQYATSTMFNQNILDRRESVRNTEENIWMRTNHNETRYDQLDGLQHTKTNNTILQAGMDIIRHEDYTVGAYMGYGQSRTQNHSKQTGTGSNARANGYQVGIYGTWMPDANQGLYVDVWGHYAWYKNRLEGEAQQYSHVKYNSHGYTLSVEAGYGFNVATTETGRTWIVQPHAQVIYNNLETKGFTDNNYTDFAKKNAGGFNTRIGVRFYGEEPAGKQGVLSFIEANWLYNGIKTTANLNNSNFKEKIGKNVGELKLGLNGHINDQVSVFGYIGVQLGNHDYKRGEVQLGLNVKW